MIKLVILPPAFGLRNVSPFCLKAEMALNYLGLEFEIDYEANPQKAPKGKLPFLVTDGEKLADSELIFEHLDKISGGRLFAGLTDLEIAQGTAFTRLVDDHLYWILVASRWLDDSWFDNVVKGFFDFLPPGIKQLVSRSARKTMAQTYRLHGLGKHTPEEQAQFARRDLQAIATVVGQHNYIVGQRLTPFDFSVASLVIGILDQQPPTWLNAIADEFPALREYVERVQSEIGVIGRELDAA